MIIKTTNIATQHWQLTRGIIAFTPATTSNVTTAPTHSLPGSDSVRLPDESASSLTGPLGLLETSQLEVTTPN